MSGTCHAQLFMTQCIAKVHQQQPPVPAGNPDRDSGAKPMVATPRCFPWVNGGQSNSSGRGCAAVKPGEAGGMCLDATRRAQRPIDLRYHAIAPAGQGTRSIPRHNHLRGSRKGDHWTISYKRSRGVLRIETMGDSRERHVRNLPCATIFDVVYRSHSFRKSDEGSG